MEQIAFGVALVGAALGVAICLSVFVHYLYKAAIAYFRYRLVQGRWRKKGGESDWVAIRDEIGSLRAQLSTLYKKAESLQQACDHPKLPKRKLGEEYMDQCPDCGFSTYAYWW